MALLFVATASAAQIQSESIIAPLPQPYNDAAIYSLIYNVNTTIWSSIFNMQSDIYNIQTDVSNLQTDVSNLQTDVSNLQTDVSNLQTGLSAETLNRINNDTYIISLINNFTFNSSSGLNDEIMHRINNDSKYYLNSNPLGFLSSANFTLIDGQGQNSIIARPLKGAGQLSLTNGSGAVVGIGTDFIGSTIFNLDDYYQFYICDAAFITCTPYYVFPINSDTSANLTATLFGSPTTWTGATGLYDFYLAVNFANETFSKALGFQSRATGVAAISFGTESQALGSNSIAFGSNSIANASGAVAWGSNSLASGLQSTAFGLFTIASGNTATTFGQNNIASGTYSLAAGYNTRATGQSATTFGEETYTDGKNSFAMGYRTNSTSYAALVIGRYNVGGGTFNQWIANDPVFEIGIGNATNKENAFTVYKNGSIVAPNAPWALASTQGKHITNVNMTTAQLTTTSATVYTNIPALTQNLNPNMLYLITCELTQSAAAATTGVVLQVNTTGTPTLVRSTYTKMSSASAMETFSGTNVASNTFAATGSSTTVSIAQLNSLVQTNGEGSNYTISFRSEVAGSAARIETGSYCMEIEV